MSDDLYPVSFNISDSLKCPNCGGEYLHQVSVEVFWRAEDAVTGDHVFTDGVILSLDRDLSNNPSPRRQGLTIYFDCETCDRIPRFHMIQHKGNTYTWMDISEERSGKPE